MRARLSEEAARLLAQTSATPGRPRGKSKKFTRRAYPAVEEGDEEDEDSWWEDSWEGYHLEAYPAASYDDDDDDDPELVPHEDQDYEEFELDEPEAIALNSIEELDDTADAGHAIPLQLAANAAFGKAKGKGKRPKGKGKGKGKVVRSHLTLEQRRDKPDIGPVTQNASSRTGTVAEVESPAPMLPLFKAALLTVCVLRQQPVHTPALW